MKKSGPEPPITAEQIVLILAANYYDADPRIEREREAINEKYRDLKGTPIDGKLPGFTYASVQSKVWWLRQNVLGLQ
jgi:hypothetical protein